MISTHHTTKRGMVRRSRRSSAYFNSLGRVGITTIIPTWLRQWISRQPESMGLLIEKAIVGHFGIEPPEPVKRALERQKSDVQQKLDAENRAK